MLYLHLKKDFVWLEEPTGIIQNLSPFTLEVSTTDEPDSGIPILPHKNHFFNEPVYVRCIDGVAKARVITAGVNSCDATDLNFDSCCSNALCSSCCDNNSGNEKVSGIEGILIDGVEQVINDDNFAVLDLSDYLKEDYDNITYSDIANLFR